MAEAGFTVPRMASDSAPTPESTGAASASDLIATLRTRAPRLAMGIAAGQLVYPIVKSAREKRRDRSRFTVKVLSTDDVYDDLHEWVLGMLPTDDQRALVAWTSKRGSYAEPTAEGGHSAPPARVRLRYDGSREQEIRLAGHRVRVVVSDGGEPGAAGDRYKPSEIIFTAPSLAGQRALLDAISDVARRSRESERRPAFRMLTKWGDWQRLDELPQRDLDSVILADGQLERLVADVDAFLAAEADYLRRCVPWHRGHLYEGPPGTGKTSVARALASHFKMDIWYLPLSDVDKDANLLGAISRITPRSMLLLEDADVFHAATQRHDGDGGVTLSGLLNALDGIATPHGLLTVLTTNTPDILDRAVVRPGRVDLVEHFGLADNDQIRRLLSRWYDQAVSVPAGVSGMSPAEVVEVCKRKRSPRGATTEIAERTAAATNAVDEEPTADGTVAGVPGAGWVPESTLRGAMLGSTDRTPRS